MDAKQILEAQTEYNECLRFEAEAQAKANVLRKRYRTGFGHPDKLTMYHFALHEFVAPYSYDYQEEAEELTAELIDRWEKLRPQWRQEFIDRFDYTGFTVGRPATIKRPNMIGLHRLCEICTDGKAGDMLKVKISRSYAKTRWFDFIEDKSGCRIVWTDEAMLIWLKANKTP